MGIGGGYDYSFIAYKARGFYIHSANAITKEGISTEDFQKFIDVASGTGFRIDTLMNICKLIDISLINGQTSCLRVFHKQLNWIF